MLLEAYRAIKNKLQTDIPELKLIDWFNDQYSGTIHTVPAVFIEFPNELNFKNARREFQISKFKARIHLVTKALSDNSKHIKEELIQEHETLSQKIFYSLHQLWAMYEADKKLFDSLTRTTYQHYQYLKGWLITTQDFESQIYQHEAPKKTMTVTGLAVTVEKEN